MILTTNAALFIVAAALAVARVGGVIHPSFQAAAHLFTGGLIAASATEHYYTWAERKREGGFKFCLAVALSVVELGCFLFLPHS